ncbi:MAG: YidC/Oxa1 family membrane protein insertase, partial [Candidatus Sumerlaeota bacterium]|nr:YidC/Oxa1 family membrane protein insertase [Candidatus Sumerlaeota bacterium]
LIQSFNLLPILMSGTQFLTSKLSTSTVTDPSQRQMVILMPLMFMFIFYNMSAGLVLYWFVSNIWQIGSQVWINRMIKKEDDRAPARAPVPAPPKDASGAKRR